MRGLVGAADTITVTAALPRDEAIRLTDPARTPGRRQPRPGSPDTW